jgi:replication factor C small subunit
MKSQYLWTEKYRPQKISDYVFKDPRQRRTIEGWIQDKNIPHILFHGPAGTGKSSIVTVLLNEIGVQKGDILYVNASEERKVDTIRNKVLTFAQTIGVGDFKVILLEEAEQITSDAQPMLKRIMEDYAEACRFIMTSNNPFKLIAPLRSRLTEMHCDKLDIEEFQLRAAQILVEEEVEFRVEDLDSYIRAAYPDMRKMINFLQENSHGKVLQSPTGEEGSSDYMLEAIELFKAGKITDGRNLICSKIQDSEYEEFYRFMYRNLDLWANDEIGRIQATHLIRDYLLSHAMIADPEINLSDCLGQMSLLHTK